MIQKKRAKAGKLSARQRKTNIVILVTAILAMLSIQDDLTKKQDAVTFLDVGTPTYGVEST